MRVQELMELLEDFDPEAEVRLAFQPHWPLQYHIGEVVECSEFEEQEELDHCRDDLHELQRMQARGEEVSLHEKSMLLKEIKELSEEAAKAPRVVWIAEGGQLRDAPYLPGAAQSELGWRSR